MILNCDYRPRKLINLDISGVIHIPDSVFEKDEM